MENNSKQDSPWYAKSYDTDRLVQKIMPSGKNILTKNYDAEGFFKNALGPIINKPLWVKQAIYLELREDIKKLSSIDLLEELDKNDLLQLYVPRLSIIGMKIVNEKEFAKSQNISVDIMMFLKSIDNKKNVIDLCEANQQSLKQLSKAIIISEENGFIEPIRSNQIISIFKFIADKLDIGDLAVRLNLVTAEELSFARFSISEMNKTFDIGESTKIEDILVRMNYISKEQLANILLLKEASDLIFENQMKNTSPEMEILQENIDMLLYEKSKVEEELKAVQPLIASRDRRIRELEEELNKYKQLCENNQQNKSFFNKL